MREMYKKKVLTRESEPTPFSYHDSSFSMRHETESGHTSQNTVVYQPTISKEQLSKLVSNESRYIRRSDK